MKQKKIPVRKSKFLPTQKKLSTKLIIGILILFISLFLIIIFIKQPQILTGNAENLPSVLSPTYGSIEDCHANGTCPTTSTVPGGNSTVTINPINPQNTNIQSPCAATNGKTTSMSMNQGKSTKTNNNAFLQIILEFIQLLLQLLQHLGGGNTTSPTPVINQPTQGAQPTMATNPSAAPCPTSSVTQTLPTGGAPTSATSPAPVSSSMTPVGIPGTWKLIFDDEFNGTTLDTTKWAPYWFTNGANQNGTTMESSNVSESGGNLNLAVTGTTGSIISSNPSAGGHFQFTFGAMEARVFLPASGSVIANWPAFWTDGQSWPTDGEIDVVEGLHGNACYHFPPANNQGGCPGGTFTGWHTFGANWESGIVTYYYDGKAIGTISSGITSAPMYLILENSLGASSGPKVTPTTMLVDYVRVWQQ